MLTKEQLEELCAKAHQAGLDCALGQHHIAALSLYWKLEEALQATAREGLAAQPAQSEAEVAKLKGLLVTLRAMARSGESGREIDAEIEAFYRADHPEGT